MDRRGPEFERRAADWLSPAEAERRILGGCEPLPAETTPLLECMGRAVADDIVAEARLPAWDNAGMDGYAVAGREIAGASPEAPIALQVRRSVLAGGGVGQPVEEGEAVRITTGAPVPPGADSVIRVEDTDSEAHPGRVFVFRDRDGGRNIRPAGQDVRPGDKVLTRGQAVHAGTVAVLAALGRDRVSVFRRPTVAIVTTGDELRPLDDFAGGRGATGVPDSNGPMLAACAVAAGAVPRSFGPISDERAALREALGHTLSADVLVTVGGASMGEADLVKRVLDELGFRTGFWRVRMRPGSPFGFGWLPSAGRSQPVFSLPGNPASSYVTFELFVRPFLLRLAGHRQIHRRRVRCVAAEEFRGSDLTLFLRVRLASEGAEIVAHSAGPQGSGLVRGLAEAHGLAIVPEGRSVAAGAHVDVILLDPEAGPAAASPLEGLGG